MSGKASNWVCHNGLHTVTFRKVAIFFATTLLVAQDTVQNVTKQARQRIQNGDFQSASQLLQQGVQQHPSDVELWNLLGIADAELKQTNAAKRAFEHGLALAPDSVSLNENIGLVFFKQADYETAKKYLGRAVELNSQKPGVLFSLAASRLRTGEQDQALADLRLLEPALANVSDYWQERARAELSKNPGAAERSFDRALELTPDDLGALSGAATAAEKQGLDEKALAYLIRARAAFPKDVATLAHFGEVCIRRDLGPDARDALAKAHELDPTNNAVLYLLARADISLENWQQAYDLFDDFSKRVPTFAPAYYAMGWLDIRLNRTEDARRQLNHALTLDPNLAGARYELAQLDLEEGEIEPAKKLFEQLLNVNPKDAKANTAMRDIMMRSGKLEEAQTLLENAIAQDPMLAAAHYKLSLLYFRKHEREKAESEKAIAARLNDEATRTSKTQL